MAVRAFQRRIVDESRANVRTKEDAQLAWRINRAGLWGNGRVRNISVSGMLMEVTSDYDIPEQGDFSFDQGLCPVDCMPKTGRLVWQGRKKSDGKTRFCGIQFCDVPESVFSQLERKIDKGVRRSVWMTNIINTVGYLTGVAAIVLFVYSVWLGWSIYQETAQNTNSLIGISNKQAALTREYQGLYTDATRRLTDVTLELNQTTVLYQQNQQALADSQQQVAMLKSVLSQTENMLVQAQVQDSQNIEMHSISDGKTWIDLYQKRIELVRNRIDQIKRDEQVARVAALRERDRIRLNLGNQGFLVREGQNVKVDTAQYSAANPNAVSVYLDKALHSDSRVKVDVAVFQK